MTYNKQAFVSGALGATASCIAKLALAPESPVPSTVHAICIANSGIDLTFCTFLTLLARGVCFTCMIGVNASMIYLFVDGMSESGSVVGTALSTAANFSFSAVYGILFFEEFVPISWYFGAALIASGMWLLSSVTIVEKVATDCQKQS